MEFVELLFILEIDKIPKEIDYVLEYWVGNTKWVNNDVYSFVQSLRMVRRDVLCGNRRQG